MNRLIYSLSLLLFANGLFAQNNYHTLHSKTEYQSPYKHQVETIKPINNKKIPRNIILLIGDGMGVAHIYAGMTANNGHSYLEQMPVVGFSKTYSADDYITDSAAGGTAIACGRKTKNGFIGVDTLGIPILSILGIAEEHEKSTGLISTSAITHATPASFIAHQPDRDMYEEIAADFLKTPIDLFIGGGLDHFTKRKDQRNLVAELEQKGYFMGYDTTAIKSATKLPFAALTVPTHNEAFEKRGNLLPIATQKSIELLKSNKLGFFMMVEGSQIDWGAHQNDISFVVNEFLDFDKAVGIALQFAQKDKNTLVIVTADHETGGISNLGGDFKTGMVKAGFNSTDHTGQMVPVFAYGPGAYLFSGIYENTAIFDKMKELMVK